MSGWNRRILAALGLVLLAAPALAQQRPPQQTTTTTMPTATPAAERVRVVLNGAAAMGSFTLSDQRHTTDYAETSTVTSSQSIGTGYVTDLAVQVRVYRGLGVLLGYSFGSRDASGTYAAQRPHPLYLDQPRSAQGALSGYRYTENALHADVAYGGAHGKLEWVVFAGPTFFQVKADMLDQLVYSEQYPYDQLTVSSAPSRRVDVSKVGFNGGGGLDWRLSRLFGAGVQLRYAAAQAKVQATPDASQATLDAGGLQLAAGLRLHF